MTKPVDGAEALAREVLADTRIATGKVLGDCPDAVAVRAMLAHSAALVAENERLRGLHEDLKPYTSHHIGCALYQQSWISGAPRCSCGLDAARTALENDNG